MKYSEPILLARYFLIHSFLLHVHLLISSDLNIMLVGTICCYLRYLSIVHLFVYLLYNEKEKEMTRNVNKCNSFQVVYGTV